MKVWNLVAKTFAVFTISNDTQSLHRPVSAETGKADSGCESSKTGRRQNHKGGRFAKEVRISIIRTYKAVSIPFSERVLILSRSQDMKGQIFRSHRVLLLCLFLFILSSIPVEGGSVVAWGSNEVGECDVPAGLSDVIAVAAGHGHSVALKEDGTVVAWGHNTSGQADVPAGLNDVKAIAANGNFTLALRETGDVVAWGENISGQLNIPAGLGKVVAIAAGYSFGLALKGNGTVVAWGNNTYGQTNVPAGLNDAVAISAGGNNGFAVRRNGTVVSWGADNAYGTGSVPPGLSNIRQVASGLLHNLTLNHNGGVYAWGRNAFGETNVPANLGWAVSVAGGYAHSLALIEDGSVRAWGWNEHGEINVPVDLANVTAIAVGQFHNLAVVSAATAPRITSQPESRIVAAGESVGFGVAAVGTLPLHYEWRRNGIPIAGATGSRLVLNNLRIGDMGEYSVKVTNDFGVAVSVNASLAVQGDPTEGVQCVLPVYSSLPPKEVNKDSLVLVTHGWQPFGGSASWVDEMVDSITNQVPSNYQVVPYKWILGADSWPPSEALINGFNEGGKVGQDILNQGWDHVHLIGHSAGAALIQNAALVIKSKPSTTVVHLTFLDPFLGSGEEWRGTYGLEADWAENYFSRDPTRGYTEGVLPNTHNVDVTALDPNVTLVPIAGTCGLLKGCELQHFSPGSAGHAWPHDFFQATITNSGFAANHGFARSKEGHGWNDRLNYPTNTLVILESASSLQPTTRPFQNQENLSITSLPVLCSEPDEAELHETGFNFSIENFSKKSASGSTAGGSGEDTSAWISIGITITNAVNCVSFEAKFVGTNSSSLITLYWNTNQIGFIDNRVILPQLRKYTLELPETYTNGTYVLGFRLDAFTNETVAATVTNIGLGLSGFPTPAMLHPSLTDQNSFAFNITAPPGFDYLVESSTNLQDWIPASILVSTNGSASFGDSTTNRNRQFYRVVSP